MRSLIRSRSFLLGLAIRIACILLLAPLVQEEWFVPFVRNAIANPSLQPWQDFLAQGGQPTAFPYGPVMLLAHLPFVGLGMGLDHIFGTTTLAGLGFRVSLLLADIGLLGLLRQLFPAGRHHMLWFYWLSPILIYVTYVHGQTDIIPCFLFVLCLYYTQRNDFRSAGIALGLAASAKFSVLVTVPLLILYIVKSKAFRHELFTFVVAILAAAAIVQTPFLFDPGYWTMVFGTRETERLYALRVEFTPQATLFLTPLALLAGLFLAWRLARMNFDLLLAAIAIGFFLLVLTGPAPPGWFVWLVPFLAIHQWRHGRTASILVAALGITFVLYYAVEAAGAAVILSEDGLVLPPPFLPVIIPPQTMSLIFTLMIASGVAAAFQILRVGIRENDYFRLTRSPVSIGIAGDSGAGKDTFAAALLSLFGERSTTHISGDDYHVWDRYGPMWRAVTHLNPRANRLVQLTNDALDLIRRKPVVARHYDHDTGLFTQLRRIRSNDVIIVSGLHTLFMKPLRDALDVTFFLDMDEDLRRFLKYRRDSRERGYTLERVLKSLEARAGDAARYIAPQKQHATVVFKLQPINPELLSLEQDHVPPLRLRVLIRDSSFYEELSRVLIGVCNLHVNIELVEEVGSAVFEIEGEADFAKEDAELAARMICPHMSELLDRTPGWCDGSLGLMQLIALATINERLRKRR